MHRFSKSGFTLIELSIVLVIVGLIVGGILVGQDLIRAAEVRASISQIEKIKTAVNTFRGKYQWLPGDMPPRYSTRLGFFTFTGGLAGTVGYGDGNGLISGDAAFEALAYWRHLSDASLIDGSYGTSGGGALATANGAVAADLSGGSVNLVLPPFKLGRGNYIIIQGQNTIGYLPAMPRQNYYEFIGITNVLAAGTYSSSFRITPIEAQELENKIDDGKPNSGMLYGYTLAWAAGGTAGNCTMGGAAIGDGGVQYNVSSSTGGDEPACLLFLRAN